ncbi:MAG: hypothetical protein RMM17_10755 [Acidobacteriota bacterium]|nr:hypothetical protein [Blastocatellia bacterium]MDW8413151.1 hypothetical protein [Acidobacteriota bacterium]
MDATHEHLPCLPETDQEKALWADVPEENFYNPSLWLHRNSLKSGYGISERSYFRWLKMLREHGLSRSLRSSTNWKVKLFYKPDVEKAISPQHPPKTRQRLSKLQPSVQEQPPTTTTQLPQIAGTTNDLSTSSIPETANILLKVNTLEKQLSALAELVGKLQAEQSKELQQINTQLAKISSTQQILLKTIEGLQAHQPQHTPTEFFSKALQIIADMAKTHEAAILATTGKLTVDLAPLKTILKRAEQLAAQQHSKRKSKGESE